MESDRTRQRTIENARLEAEKAKNPELFPEITWTDDSSTLGGLGIYIPAKGGLPEGYLKLRPSDFIVEEIGQDGFVATVDTKEAGLPDAEGQTVYATLVKCGLSTLEAVEELSKILGIAKDKIGYAGIKDKDAITAQTISFRGINKNAVKEVHSPHLFLKDVRTGKGVVQKGALLGNSFTILIRIPDGAQDDERVRASLEALDKVQKNGFYNFFYLQRFGNPRLNNYKWAISVLKSDYERAVYGLIGDQGLREIPFFLNYRQEVLNVLPDWHQALKMLNEFPLVFPSEIKVVEHLINHPHDFSGALQKIEEQVSLWVSALASLLYNRVISSYLMADMEPPKKLPLFTSPDRNDWLPYANDLENAGLFPPDFSSLRPFRSIMIAHREISTKDHADVLGAKAMPEGIIVNFNLGKGEYATTFLSHFVTLLNGKVPEEVKDETVDAKRALGREGAEETLIRFGELNIPKK